MKCEVCDKQYKQGEGCTNGRCMSCHRIACTPFGNTTPGHGRGTKEAQARAREQARRHQKGASRG
jgi:hypothetical protein